MPLSVICQEYFKKISGLRDARQPGKKVSKCLIAIVKK
jgi:hypothetical protein